MHSRGRVALATCAALPDLDDEGAALLSALADERVAAVPAVWDDPAQDWSSYDLVVIRSTWDYAERRPEFLAWAASVPRLHNPAEVVRWNTDKHYLAELASAGVPVVATTFLEPGSPTALPAAGEYVVKPAVSAGARDTRRYAAADTALAEEHVAGLHRDGRTVMVQPYLPGVDVRGETALLYLGGVYSHSVRKAALLVGSDREVSGLYREESISRVADPAELAVAERVLAAVPGGADRLLYARVDLLPGPDDTPVLLELEVTEPSLFLLHHRGAVRRFAAAVAVAAETAGSTGSRR